MFGLSGPEKAVAKLALSSRIIMVLLIVVLDAVILDYDTSDLGYAQSSKANIITRLVSPFTHWDAVYFLDIAEKATYSFDQFHAFFPGLPTALRLVSSTLLAPFTSAIGPRTTLALAGILLSNCCFVLAAIFLYRLGLKILGEHKLAYRAALLFCINPASVFFSVVYTESLFACLVFASLDAHYSGYRTIASICMTLAASVRSNALVFAAYFAYDFLHNAVKQWTQRRYSLILISAISTAMECLPILLPPLLFQKYGYDLYCADKQTGMRPEWCEGPLPNLYSHVQKKYWNVGFMSYYELKQIPNFLIAAPILALSFTGIWSYLSFDWSRTLRLGLFTASSAPKQPVSSSSSSYFNLRLFPFIVCWAFLSAFALVLMNVQVSTRFLASSCPPLFWYIAHLFSKSSSSSKLSFLQKAILFYFLAFAFLGALLFSNFYPWT